VPDAERNLTILRQAENHHQPRRAVPIVAGVRGDQRQPQRIGEQLIGALRIVHRNGNVVEAQGRLGFHDARIVLAD
jgi:hypothetical protein